mmetsp:Transcript_1691/g.3788  ORF Transcript_1691/g.3788 Transcript_1691/m.3788 type:complete len:456 (+) Transcript_1691:99-1466(+)
MSAPVSHRSSSLRQGLRPYFGDEGVPSVATLLRAKFREPRDRPVDEREDYERSSLESLVEKHVREALHDLEENLEAEEEREERALARFLLERKAAAQAELSGLSSHRAVSGGAVRAQLASQILHSQAGSTCLASDNGLAALRSRRAVSGLSSTFRESLNTVLRSGTLVRPQRQASRPSETLPCVEDVRAEPFRRVEHHVRADAAPAPRRQRARPQEFTVYNQEDLGRYTFPSELRDRELDTLDRLGVVSDLLCSEFGSHLETVLAARAAERRRGHGVPTSRVEQARAPALAPAPASRPRGPVRWGREHLVAAAGPLPSSSSSAHSRDLQLQVQTMQGEIKNLSGLMAMCLDMQLDLQRAVRQEVAGTMRVAAAADPAGVADVTESVAASSAASQRWAAGDNSSCIVCADKQRDAVLYRCGHLCSCYACARGLQQRGLPCPVCRADIVDVIRVYAA